MNTRQYDSELRKTLKRQQRTKAYMDLQKKTSQLETSLKNTLSKRNEVISKMKAMLKELFNTTYKDNGDKYYNDFLGTLKE